MSEKLNELDPVVIGKVLRQARKDEGLTQEQVAQYLNIGRSSLVSVEKGERRLQVHELAAFCRMCGKDISDFLGIIDQKSPPEPGYLALREENRELRRLLRRSQECLNKLQKSLAAIGDIEMLDEQIHQVLAKRQKESEQSE